MGGDLRRLRVAAAAAIAVAGLGLVIAGCGDDGTSREELADLIETAREEAARSGEAQQGGAAGGESGEPAPERSPGATPPEELGTAAKGGERARIVAGFDAYMSALADRDYETACDHLAAQARGLLERAGSERKGGGCAQSLAGFQGNVRQAGEREIEQVRVDGDTAEVIFAAPDSELQRTRMHREGGEWKAGLFTLPLHPPTS